MKIVMPGGSGLVGTLLAKRFLEQGNEVVVLGRSKKSSLGGVRFEVWNGKTLGPWASEIDGADVVINLSGRSVNCRYNEKNRREILESRTLSTKAVGEAIVSAKRPPRLWLQSATATIYAHRYDAPNDEHTGVIAQGEGEDGRPTWQFSVDVAKAWEASATQFTLPVTRLTLLRTSLVMAPVTGSVFDILSKLVRLRLGGRNGDGRQFVSWIHDLDAVRAVEWIIDHEELAGPVILASPNPLPNAELMAQLRNVWGVKIGLPATRWMLEIGAFFMRTETELIEKSRRVVPTRLLESGFEFRYPRWKEAAEDLRKRL